MSRLALCAGILLEEKWDGRFAITMNKAQSLMKLTSEELAELIDRTVALEWARVSSNRIELTATGIYVAKGFLNLPR